MNPEERAVADAALQQYGARLTDSDFIARGEKVLSVKLEIKKGRLRMLDPAGRSLATYPASKIATGVSDFVEKFWFWKRS